MLYQASSDAGCLRVNVRLSSLWAAASGELRAEMAMLIKLLIPSVPMVSVCCF